MKFKTVFIVALMATFWSTDSFSQECKPVTFDGYTYDVVQIGDQCWFAENLRNEHYANGDEIPGDLSNKEWKTKDSGARAVYGEGEASQEELLENLKTYGELYNWYAVDDERGLCPTGWHVPTDGEWMTLEMELGMSSFQANSFGDRGTDQGTQMKTTYGWKKDEGNGTNSSGFAGLPGGMRTRGKFKFLGAGFGANWWSSSPLGSRAYSRHILLNPVVSRGSSPKRDGYSVRCLKD
ncbi:MAG: fibrobacter succinogenes major paralogous domain-containing protein [Flavobacteriales bacterium]